MAKKVRYDSEGREIYDPDNVAALHDEDDLEGVAITIRAILDEESEPALDEFEDVWEVSVLATRFQKLVEAVRTMNHNYLTAPDEVDIEHERLTNNLAEMVELLQSWGIDVGGS